jgi:hypothetical protein
MAGALMAYSLSGCLGTGAAERRVEILQLQTLTHSGPFQIDVSALPSDAIKSNVVQHRNGKKGLPVTSIEIDQNYPVKVIIVPATSP